MSLITPNDLAEWGARFATADQAQRAIDAAEACLGGGRYTVPDDWHTDPQYADLRLAVVMQAARLLTRPNSPNGITALGEFGPVRISRFDPDIATLLASYERINFA